MRRHNGLHILRVDSSVQREKSITRKLGDAVVCRLMREPPEGRLTVRDLASGYLRHIFAFIGIHDVRMVQAERTGSGANASEQAALDMMNHCLPVAAETATAGAQEL